MNPKPKFQLPISISIKRYLTDEKFTVESVDKAFTVSDMTISQIANICREDLIYEVLFRERFKDRPYTEKSAEDFIKWAKEGWRKNERYVFLIKDSDGNVVGAMDIKSNNLDGAEIGYWLTKNITGVMTNSIAELCSIAKKAGFKSLYGLTVPDNIKSQNVLKRAGFKDAGEVLEDGKRYLKFSKVL